MKRTYKIYLTKRDADTVKTVYDEIMRLDPKAEFQGAAGLYEAWVYNTELTHEQLTGVSWVVRAVQASNGPVLGRKFRVSFGNPLDHYSRFEIEAMQEWINVDNWGRQFYTADNMDLDPVYRLRGNKEPIGDMQYDLRVFKYSVPKDKTRISALGRYKSLNAALDTLVDMGMISAATKHEALGMQQSGSYGGGL